MYVHWTQTIYSSTQSLLTIVDTHTEWQPLLNTIEQRYKQGKHQTVDEFVRTMYEGRNIQSIVESGVERQSANNGRSLQIRWILKMGRDYGVDQSIGLLWVRIDLILNHWTTTDDDGVVLIDRCPSISFLQVFHYHTVPPSHSCDPLRSLTVTMGIQLSSVKSHVRVTYLLFT